jgi:hypothetical protein
VFVFVFDFCPSCLQNSIYFRFFVALIFLQLTYLFSYILLFLSSIVSLVMLGSDMTIFSWVSYLLMFASYVTIGTVKRFISASCYVHWLLNM